MPRLDTPWVTLIVVFALIGLNGALAGSEMALISLRDGELRRLERSGRRGRRVAALGRDPKRFLSAIQLGITLTGFLASAVATLAISRPVAALLEPLGGWAEPIGVALVTVGLSCLSMIVGELAPKRVALQRSEAWALRAISPLWWFVAALGPAIAALSWMTDALIRTVGLDPRHERRSMTKAEIIELLGAEPALTPAQQRIMARSVEASTNTVRHALLPRPAVVTIDASTPAECALATLQREKITRAPVVQRDLDHPVGHVHVRDLIGASGPAGDHVHPLLALPESLSVLEALEAMQSGRTKIALVVDEYGGGEGIVTAEDLLEELVGDVDDESDDPTGRVRRGAAGSIVAVGDVPCRELSQVGVEIPEGDYVTVAGWILERLGRFPENGERLTIDDQFVVIDRWDGPARSIVRIEPSSSLADVEVIDVDRAAPERQILSGGRP